MQETLLNVTIGFTFGIIGAAIGRSFALRRKKKAGQTAPLSENQQKLAANLYSIFRFFSRSLYVVLAISLVWTLYYLALGLLDAGQTEYATNVSQLIVSVVTVFSILIAFFEFMHRGKSEAKNDDETDK